jgi:hypothetical protein
MSPDWRGLERADDQALAIERAALLARTCPAHLPGWILWRRGIF